VLPWDQQGLIVQLCSREKYASARRGTASFSRLHGAPHTLQIHDSAPLLWDAGGDAVSTTILFIHGCVKHLGLQPLSSHERQQKR
jgi:hypothetical protein